MYCIMCNMQHRLLLDRPGNQSVPSLAHRRPVLATPSRPEEMLLIRGASCSAIAVLKGEMIGAFKDDSKDNTDITALRALRPR